MSKLPRRESFGYQVNHLGRLFARALDRKIQPLGVSTGQMPTLLALFEQDGLSQKELIARVQVEQPTLANTLNRMERDGLVQRESDDQDKRSSRFFLTEKARDIQSPLIASARAINALAVTGFAEQEQQQLLDLLTRMIGNLQTGGHT
ncbi:MarR family winged helix-turn-helix transcriptional regulator [Aestuariispira insulae]|uniref:DNA-binding MarR family transcriptional regulator n=1 Tax=Aestuariispira insulae TaxID=1461337 RepID=A0A3D9H9G4_9PROT|nr:MarR family transcriptional regulator [Aestuariispira insulae]RED46125.1 DNA-binding MarR family transcriptional regulator [Aestuariispira insulae]